MISTPSSTQARFVNKKEMKEKEIPADVRKYLKMLTERLRRGVLTFEYLERRQPQKNVKNRKGL